MHLQQRSVCDPAQIQNPLGDGDTTSSVHCLVSPLSSPTTAQMMNYNIVRDYLILTA